MELHLEDINKVSPYRVEWEGESKEVLLFFTDSGGEYRVAFALDDYSAEGLEMYQFELLEGRIKSKGYDAKIYQVICAIIEEFLKSNQKAILYAADMSDGRELCRQRLFFRWYNRVRRESKESYILVPIGDIAGLIVRKDNPQLVEYLQAVEYFSGTLQK